MPLFAYRAVNALGKNVTGRVEAVNLFDLEQRLARMGLDLINGAPTEQRSRLIGGGRVARQDLINFCFHLEQLAKAGVPLIEGLSDLRESLENARFREVVSGLIESIEGGKTLSSALGEFPEVFSKVFVSLIRSGEQTGRLAEVLASLTESLKWEDELAAQTKKLLMYPAFVASIVVLVFFFLMIYLVPQMTGFIRNMGQQIPLQTRVLMAVSDFFVSYWWTLIAAPILAWIGLRLAMKNNPKVGYMVDHLKISQPLENALRMAGQQIGDGKNTSAAFADLALFPPLVIRMLRIGEATGALDTALLNVSYFYNREVREAIGKLQAMIEPALTEILGLVLGWVMLAVLGPVYDTISKMKF